jgi:hypothetical protein
MKVSEKSLELNVGTELLNLMRGPWGLRKAYLRGLTQKEERREGVDFFAQLTPTTRLFAFQFKAPRGRREGAPYRYTLERYQHDSLFSLAQQAPNSVFYVFPFYVTPRKLQRDVPQLLEDTWLLQLEQMPSAEIFGTRQTRTVRCRQGVASINPDYQILKASNIERVQSRGIPARSFAGWYERYLQGTQHEDRRRSPWLVRGLRVAIVTPE